MAFNLSGQRWNPNDLTVTWSIATQNFGGQPGGNFSSFIGSQAVINDIATAISWWDNASGLTFQLVPDASNVDVRFGYGPVAGSATGLTSYSFDGNNHFIPGITIRLEYSDAAPAPRPLIAHEVGHAIGLTHIETETAMMNSTVNNAWTALFASDIQGVQHLYGAGGGVGSVAIGDVSIVEGNAGTRAAVFTVTRNGGTGAFSVNFATANNTATAGSDYVANSGTLSFGANETSRTISVTINGDTTVEANETFVVNLSAATNGATISDSQGVGTISNDDAAAADDFAGNTGTTGQVSPGNAVSGNLEAPADRDWFRVQLNANTTYTINVLGAETGNGTLADPYLRVYNSVGDTILVEDDDSGAGRNSQLAFTPGVTGTYYIAAGAFNDAGTGTYVVAVSPPAGNPAVGTLDDVLWRHTDGTLTTSDHSLGLVSNGWTVVGTGDTDGDGGTDIVWRNQDTIVLWEMRNGQYLTHHTLAQVGSSWTIAGLGDFDRDGDDDILWRSNDGRVLTWELEDNGLVRTHSLPSASNDWRVAGIGDFDGDGDDDLVWHHIGGQVVTWEMQNDGLRATRSVASASGGWNIQGAGDFDRDGDDDLVWRNAEGRVTTWEMQNNTYVVNRNIESGGNSWSIYGVHDFDTDGDSDILWRNDNGTVLTWEMNGFGFVRTHNFGVVPNAWKISGVGDFDLA